jgi:3-methyladenine DNA glycosylase AlkD
MKTVDQIIKELKKQSVPKNLEGMARFGIKSDKSFGITMPVLRKMAKEIGKNHKLALQLWRKGFRETRLLAGMVDEIDKVTEKQMDSWIKDFDSWDVCDLVCMDLFDKSPIAFRKAIEWTKKSSEFEKRAGFALMASLASHDKEAGDNKFIKFLPHIKRESSDERNYVKKSANWALRGIGKRNKNLNKEAIKVARAIQKIDSKPAKWIANDALRELKSEAVQKRLANRAV